MEKQGWNRPRSGRAAWSTFTPWVLVALLLALGVSSAQDSGAGEREPPRKKDILAVCVWNAYFHELRSKVLDPLDDAWDEFDKVYDESDSDRMLRVMKRGLRKIQSACGAGLKKMPGLLQRYRSFEVEGVARKFGKYLEALRLACAKSARLIERTRSNAEKFLDRTSQFNSATAPLKHVRFDIKQERKWVFEAAQRVLKGLE